MRRAIARIVALGAFAGFADVGLDGDWEFRFEEGKPIEQVSLTNFAASGPTEISSRA